MTEQEIIDYLKQNRTKGVAFGFMPKEVRDWCCNRPNYCNDFLQYKNGAWRDEYCFVNPKDIKEMASEEIIILALPYSFQIQQKQQKKKGSWKEFEIEPYKDKAYRFSADNRAFNWFDWQYFLQYSLDCNLGFTAFGGWQYKDCDTWFLTPQITMQSHYYNLCTKDDEPKPAIPIKIRFWRESK